MQQEPDDEDSFTEQELLDLYLFPVYDNHDSRQVSFLEACIA